MAGIGATGSIGAYAAQSDYSKSTKTKKPEVFGTSDKTAAVDKAFNKSVSTCIYPV